jgi:acyl-CoA dehydrogenase
MNVSSLQSLRPEVVELKKKLDWFVEYECIPAEIEYQNHMKTRYGTQRWTDDAIPPCLFRLQTQAKQLGLWNLFLPSHYIPIVQELCPDMVPSISLSYREYGMLCESMGRCPDLAPQACNCSAPDTGNMEVLLAFGTKQQQDQYLIPLLRGEIRSTFFMTEPNVASSDPTNLCSTLVKTIDPDGMTIRYELSGHKWWSTGAMDPRCRCALAVVRIDESHPSNHTSHNNNKNNSNHPVIKPQLSSSLSRQQQQQQQHNLHTIVIFPMPYQGVMIQRPLTVFGYDDAPFGHAEVKFHHVPLSTDHIIGGEGKGFEIAQARLGPGRIHHCMRAIGMGK